MRRNKWWAAPATHMRVHTAAAAATAQGHAFDGEVEEALSQLTRLQTLTLCAQWLLSRPNPPGEGLMQLPALRRLALEQLHLEAWGVSELRLFSRLTALTVRAAWAGLALLPMN